MQKIVYHLVVSYCLPSGIIQDIMIHFILTMQMCVLRSEAVNVLYMFILLLNSNSCSKSLTSFYVSSYLFYFFTDSTIFLIFLTSFSSFPNLLYTIPIRHFIFKCFLFFLHSYSHSFFIFHLHIYAYSLFN